MVSNKNIKYFVLSIFFGSVIGFINGIFGGGGGMIVVPVLTNIFGLEDRKAHATALLIIFPLSAISSAIYIINKSVDWNTIIYSGSGFLIGGIIGSVLLNKISNNSLRKFFSLLMIICGVVQIVK